MGTAIARTVVLPEGEGIVVSLVPIIGPRAVEMNAVNADALCVENRNGVIPVSVFETKSDAAIRAEFFRAGDQSGGEPIALEQGFGADGMMRRKETDQAVHVLTSRFTPGLAHTAIWRNASNPRSTSAGVLNHPKLKRTVPVGKVPRV